MIETDPIPPALRYQALMRSGGRCALCGATKDETTLHVDHILPRSKGGKNTLDNLQVLCAACNQAKSNRDRTDFRAMLRVAETTSYAGCPLCSPDLQSKAIVRGNLSYAVPHPSSPVSGHLIVVPFRHASDFLALTADERRDSEDLLRVLGNECQSSDSTVKGFSILTGSTIEAGLAAHAHLHLIPDRTGHELAAAVEQVLCPR